MTKSQDKCPMCNTKLLHNDDASTFKCPDCGFIRDDITRHDSITGRRGTNPLNRNSLDQHELDEVYGGFEE